MNIIKRDGRIVKFDEEKIINAVLSAFEQVDGQISDYAMDKAGNIAGYIKEFAETCDHELTIEEIQNLVQKGLMSTKRKDVAEAYITYRHDRDVERNRRSDAIKEYDKKISGNNNEKQNANVDALSYGGRKGEAGNVIAKEHALEYRMSKLARNRHINNQIYTHDLDSYSVGMHNCLTIPFDDLLAKGFNTRQTDVRPANSINTAFQLLAVIFQVQSLQQFGGVSASHLDWTMVPYVRKSFRKHFIDGMRYIQWDDWCNEQLKNIKIEDYPIVDGTGTSIYEMNESAFRYAMNMTERELRQAVEGMYHNLNTLQSRSGNQLPFTSINYGTCTLTEGRMVTKALLEGCIKGVGKFHRTSIFPCGIFQCMKGVNRKPGDPNYDLFQLALKSTSLRLYPNYANVDWSGNKGYDINDPKTYFSTMGCRTANGWDINGFGQLKDGRGNIAPVTIILPTVAMEAKEKCNDELDYKFKLPLIFMDLLDKRIHEAKNILIERFEYICSQPPEAAKFMYENNVMAGYVPEEGIRSALKHGTLAIGNLGLAEALQILVGCDHTEEEGMKLAKKIYELFQRRCAEFKEEYKLNFGVYNTPKLLGLGVA